MFSHLELLVFQSRKVQAEISDAREVLLSLVELRLARKLLSLQPKSEVERSDFFRVLRRQAVLQSLHPLVGSRVGALFLELQNALGPLVSIEVRRNLQIDQLVRLILAMSDESWYVLVQKAEAQSSFQFEVFDFSLLIDYSGDRLHQSHLQVLRKRVVGLHFFLNYRGILLDGRLLFEVEHF